MRATGTTGPGGVTKVSSSPPETSPWAFLAFLLRRKSIVACITLVAVGMGCLHYQQSVPIYQSSAVLLTVRRQAIQPVSAMVAEGSNGETLVALLRSPRIIGKAVERQDLDQISSIKSSDNPVSHILSRLASTTSSGINGDIIHLTYRSEDQAECQDVVTAVMNEFIEFMDDSRQNLYAEVIDLISLAKEQLGAELTNLKSDYRRFRSETRVILQASDDSGTHSTSRSKPHEDRLAKIDSMRSDVILENYKTQATIDAIEAALEHDVSREALNLMIGHIDAEKLDNNITGILKSVLLPMIAEELILVERHGPNHPEVKAIREKIELTRKHLLNASPDQESEGLIDFCQVYLNSLREQIKLGERKIKTYDQSNDKELKSAMQLTADLARDEGFRLEINRTQRLYDAAVRRLEEIDFVGEVNAFDVVNTEVLHPPSSAAQVEPNLKKTMTASVLIGLVLGMGLAFVVDTADKRF